MRWFFRAYGVKVYRMKSTLQGKHEELIRSISSCMASYSNFMFRTEERQFDYFVIHRVHITVQCYRWTIKNSYDFKVNCLGTLGNSFAIFHYRHETNYMNEIAR